MPVAHCAIHGQAIGEKFWFCISIKWARRKLSRTKNRFAEASSYKCNVMTSSNDNNMDCLHIESEGFPFLRSSLAWLCRMPCTDGHVNWVWNQLGCKVYCPGFLLRRRPPLGNLFHYPWQAYDLYLRENSCLFSNCFELIKLADHSFKIISW